MKELLFKNVVCKGYLHKQETKYVYTAEKRVEEIGEYRKFALEK